METDTGENKGKEKNKFTSINIQNLLIERMSRGEEIPPSDYVHSGILMVTHLGQITDEVYRLKQMASKIKVAAIEAGDSAAKADAIMEASEQYLWYKRLQARAEQIEQIGKMTPTMTNAKQKELDSPLNK